MPPNPKTRNPTPRTPKPATHTSHPATRNPHLAPRNPQPRTSHLAPRTSLYHHSRRKLPSAIFQPNGGRVVRIARNASQIQPDPVPVADQPHFFAAVIAFVQANSGRSNLIATSRSLHLDMNGSCPFWLGKLEPDLAAVAIGRKRVSYFVDVHVLRRQSRLCLAIARQGKKQENQADKAREKQNAMPICL